MTVFQKNINRVCPILENPTPDNPILDFPIPDYPTSENPMQLNKDILNTDLLSKEKRNTDIQIYKIPFPFLSVPLTTLLLTGKQYHSRKGSKWIKSHQRKNKFRSKHRKRVLFSVNLLKMLEFISAPEAAKKMGHFRKTGTKAM